MPRRQVVGHQPPRTAGTQHVPDRVQHQTQPMESRPALPHDRQQRLDDQPLLIGQTTGVMWAGVIPAACLCCHEPGSWQGCPKWTKPHSGQLATRSLRLTRHSLSDASGRFTFVVMPDWSIRALRSGGLRGHADLAEGQNIILGGHFTIRNGTVSGFNNFSGHYRPHSDDPAEEILEAIGREAFRRNGIKGADDAIWSPFDWRSVSAGSHS